ncbi:MAG TPA: F0F1 ATP synthase subunit delta [Gammaproteobacteria bacterium]
MNWTTFVLEIVNFLILVWLLKRFLYKPVRAAVERRRQSIEQQLAKAQQQQNEADAMRLQYENRLHDWEAEREGARQQLQREIEEERKHLQEQLRQSLDTQRQKAEVLATKQLEEHRRDSEFQALQQGAQFAARLLSQAATPELQARLFALLLEELQQLPLLQRESLQASTGGKAVEVVSAYELSVAQQQQIQEAFTALVGQPLPFHFASDDKLIAGLRITAGPCVLHANLHDELKAFAALSHEL